jgi:phenylacetate-CoA ligase
VSEAQYYVEVVDNHYQPCEPGVEGTVLVTLLTNSTMPLIRYRIEDRAVWASGQCECGRTTKRLSTITGRQNDFLVAADGTRVNGTALTTLLYGVPGIRRFQYRQPREDHVILTIEPLDVGTHALLSQNLREPMERLSGLLKGTTVELVFASQITPSKSGKYRYVLNETVQA